MFSGRFLAATAAWLAARGRRKTERVFVQQCLAAGNKRRLRSHSIRLDLAINVNISAVAFRSLYTTSIRGVSLQVLVAKQHDGNFTTQVFMHCCFLHKIYFNNYS